MIGDFNEILSNNNKSGGTLQNEAQMANFRIDLDHCSLYEQPFDGDPFTWIKGRCNVTAMKERLDWCFVNIHWRDTFVLILTKHLDYFGSNRRAILVKVLPLTSQHIDTPTRSRFRFERLWLHDAEAAAIIQQTWVQKWSGTYIDNFCSNIEACSKSLQQ